MRLPIGVAQYFFDDTLIQGQQRLVRRWLSGTPFHRPVIEPDRPWEDRIIGLYGTILPHTDGYMMYYTSFAPGVCHPKIMLVTSPDGLRWRKPSLGLVQWKDSSDNNIVLAPEGHIDSASFVLDTEDSEDPYKMLVFKNDNPESWWGPNCGLFAYTSSDGLRWKEIPGLRLRAGDATNVVSRRVDGKFVVYTRSPDMWDTVGARAIYRSESVDFLNWSDLQLVFAPDLADEPDIEYYSMSVFERNNWHFGLLAYWDRASDVLGARLAISRDGCNWIQPEPWTSFVSAEHDWNKAWITFAGNGPIIINEQMVFYFGGRSVAHGFDSAQQYGAIGYASLPLDRFCAIEATTGGQMTTVPLEWPGGDLVLNADCRESFTSHPMTMDGEIAVEVLDAEGTPMPEWSGKHSAVFRGNTHCRSRVFEGSVHWSDGRSLREFGGKTIRLRFRMKHARLFTIEAR